MPTITDVRNVVNPLVRWKIYYHDPDHKDHFFTFSNLDGTAEEAPIFGVQFVLQPIDHGRSVDRVVFGDYYALDEENKWIGMSEAGKADRDLNNIPYSALKEGRWINTERFQDIWYLAGADEDFVEVPDGRISRIPAESRVTR